MIYPRLKDLREDMDLSQSEIANQINTTQSYYAQYENGRRAIPFERVIELAKYYNVSLDYIAGRTNDKKGLTRSELSDIDTELLSKFHLLSDNGKGKLLERLDIILESEEQQCINKGTA